MIFLYFIEKSVTLRKIHSKMEVILNIPNSNDWVTLYPLLQRLGISVLQTKPLTPTPVSDNAETDWNIIMKGIKIDKIDDFMNDFEASRQDRILPFRD